MDWNDKIILTDDQKGNTSRTVLEPGEYDFTIKGLERKQTKYGDPMAVITFEVGDPLDQTIIKENFVIKENCLWKLVELHESIGLKKKGQDVEVDFNKLVGRTGRCSVYTEEYTKRNGQPGKSNKIDTFLVEDDFTF